MSNRIELADGVDLVRNDNGEYCIVRNAMCTPLGDFYQAWEFAGELNRGLIRIETLLPAHVDLGGES